MPRRATYHSFLGKSTLWCFRLVSPFCLFVLQKDRNQKHQLYTFSNHLNIHNFCLCGRQFYCFPLFLFIVNICQMITLNSSFPKTRKEIWTYKEGLGDLVSLLLYNLFTTMDKMLYLLIINYLILPFRWFYDSFQYKICFYAFNTKPDSPVYYFFSLHIRLFEKNFKNNYKALFF